MNKHRLEIRQTALDVIDKEQLAINGLRSSIDHSFLDVVDLLYASKGRLIVTGIGKSAIIGQKVVATLNSTGTPAVFMHAADAIHGDLGIVQPGDVVMCLSKSGETAEIKVLVPLIRKMGNPLIGMVGNRESYLGRSADYVLLASAPHEACPNDLAPTASTTAQMVLGDALAVCLLRLRGFTPSDFARFHPGGSLGKKLYLTVSDIMNPELRPFVRPGESVRDTILVISKNRLGATAVLDHEDKLLGIITDGDVRRMVEKNRSLESLCACDIMTKNPKTIPGRELAVHAYRMMEASKITQLIVLQDDRYAGMVHIHDIIREGIV
ncbi:MAG: KpsF/GutQ family sugar-phosphate isomerase [Bacteroidales bacterium]|nr:KpsF/GutQ family sugar-phosphate isomerase [Bacteroidales bacterium]MDD4030469.1 KpsF/GutQ family sugar-phosphate isomerase [Bacteroidales bacterium]MDD4436123.1 KpsF/GutQ family sugar-phosphate isomerase [Bacteroidales bacterium]MDD5733142.1 KpsF/GutQ family sugar-phosphate isomerase [Bacteroidales bacterium]